MSLGCFRDLSKNELGGVIPSQICALVKLLSMCALQCCLASQKGDEIYMNLCCFRDLSKNRLGGAIPSQISALVKLTDLRLNFNLLSGSVPSQISTLVGLTKLNLQRNGLSGSIPSQISALVKLMNLQLNGNWLSGSIPSQFSTLGQLTMLFVFDNYLEGPTASAMFNGTNAQGALMRISEVQRNGCPHGKGFRVHPVSGTHSFGYCKVCPCSFVLLYLCRALLIVGCRLQRSVYTEQNQAWISRSQRTKVMQLNQRHSWLQLGPLETATTGQFI